MKKTKLKHQQQYVLNGGAVWIEVKDKLVHLSYGPDGVSVTIYENDEDKLVHVAETWAEFYS